MWQDRIGKRRGGFVWCDEVFFFLGGGEGGAWVGMVWVWYGGLVC